jgi:hypothetical protein
MEDPTKIECILDVPLAQVCMPHELRHVYKYYVTTTTLPIDTLRSLDHGIVHGWNQTRGVVPIISKVHPENFTTKGWALLHHAGFLTYPHHDAEGTLTWVRMEVGLKFWVIFWLKSGRNDRIQLRNLAVKLADFSTNIKWIQKNCDGEVITLVPGDIL